MAGTPIFVATHPRSCSTAFERVFMTRPEDLQCAHEPFGDAYYYGPERLGDRFADDAAGRESSGFAKTTYKDVVDRLDAGDKRLFVKDMAYYLFAPDGQATDIAPSLVSLADGELTQSSAPSLSSSPSSTSSTSKNSNNPTVLPENVLRRFHFAFLIRHPRRAIPSYYRCTVPPLVDTTGFRDFMPSEAGYTELRRLFDYLRSEGLVGTEDGEAGKSVPITVIDADDLLDRPVEAIQAFCRDVGLDYTPAMLQWADDRSQQHAAEAFAKWAGFHNDALASTGLKARAAHHKTPSTDLEDKEWKAKFGDDGQKAIRDCVEANIEDYEYLKSFALKF